MFGWFRRKDLFEGVDVTGYQYIGYSMLTFHDDKNQGKVFARAPVHFFFKKDDPRKRKVVIADRDYIFDNHTWVKEWVPPWLLGEFDLEYLIITFPSKWTREHVLKTKNKVWNNKEKMWMDATVPNIPDPIVDVEDNVIKVSFKPNKDVDKS